VSNRSSDFRFVLRQRNAELGQPLPATFAGTSVYMLENVFSLEMGLPLLKVATSGYRVHRPTFAVFQLGLFILKI
jgi:hypothetical protein